MNLEQNRKVYYFRNILFLKSKVTEFRILLIFTPEWLSVFKWSVIWVSQLPKIMAISLLGPKQQMPVCVSCSLSLLQWYLTTCCRVHGCRGLYFSMEKVLSSRINAVNDIRNVGRFAKHVFRIYAMRWNFSFISVKYS